MATAHDDVYDVLEHEISSNLLLLTQDLRMANVCLNRRNFLIPVCFRLSVKLIQQRDRSAMLATISIVSSKSLTFFDLERQTKLNLKHIFCLCLSLSEKVNIKFVIFDVV